MSTDTTRKHPFLDDLAPDAQLTGSLLRRPICGRDNIRRAVQTVGTLYASQTPLFFGVVDGRGFLQYEAVLHNGRKVQAVVVIERDDAGLVQRVSVTLGPIDALLSLAGRLGPLLENELGADLFL